ncbi:PRC-barrel domain-containing protein [Methylocystis sp. 9N]|uniref:PRC-barrel domain-containing protein n=1 Tax=Methylocystis borbori TaxID=3118750 RepID=A0ABU7XKL6_9HYPH
MYKAAIVAASIALSAFAAPPLHAQPVENETVLVIPLDALPIYGSVVSAWYKQPVYDANEKKLGVIADMLFSADGSINAVMLDVGGFLGIGVKHVAVPVNKITITEKDKKSWLTLNTTKEILKKAVGYKFDKETRLWNPA